MNVFSSEAGAAAQQVLNDPYLLEAISDRLAPRDCKSLACSSKFFHAELENPRVWAKRYGPAAVFLPKKKKPFGLIRTRLTAYHLSIPAYFPSHKGSVFQKNLGTYQGKPWRIETSLARPYQDYRSSDLERSLDRAYPIFFARNRYSEFAINRPVLGTDAARQISFNQLLKVDYRLRNELPLATYAPEHVWEFYAALYTGTVFTFFFSSLMWPFVALDGWGSGRWKDPKGVAGQIVGFVVFNAALSTLLLGSAGRTGATHLLYAKQDHALLCDEAVRTADLVRNFKRNKRAST